MIITDKAQIKIAELRESNNLRLSESDELECYELIESDLKLPADVTFTRSSVAYLSDGTQVDVNTPRFEQGKFGKALLLEENTTNLLTANQSSVETDLTGFTRVGASTLTRDTTTAWHGVASIKTIASTSGAGWYIQVPGGNVPRNTAYAASLYVKGAGQIYVELYHNVNVGNLQRITVNLKTDWQRVIVTGTTRDEDYPLRLYVRSSGGAAEWYADGIQVEQKPYATSFIDSTRSGATNLVPSLVDFTLIDYASRSLTVIDDNMVISTCIAEGDTAFAAISPKVNVTEGEIYTFSFYAKANGLDGLDGRPSAANRRTKINWYDGNNTLIAWDMLTDTALYEDWKRYIITAQAPTGAIKAEVVIGGDSPNFSYVGAKVYFKNIQFEQKPYATPIDGTRSAETLTIPTAGVLNPQEGTIEIICMKPKYLNYNARVFWAEQGGSRFGIHDNPSGGLAWAYCSADTQIGAGRLLEGQWHYLAMSWNRDEGWVKCYLDGDHIRTMVFEPGTNPGFVGSELLGIGCHPTYAGQYYFNGFFDDLRISSRARTDEEILAAYQSGQPLPVDEWTTYKLDFDDKVRITTQGQIICNELIEI